MDRILTYDMAKAIKDKKSLCLLVMIDHPSGVFRGWTGIGSLEYDNQIWTGVGRLGQITPVNSVSDISIQEVRFTLSGVDPDNLDVLNEAVRLRPAQAWLACLDDKGKIVDEPFQLLDCEMDTQELNVEEGGTATIVIIARSGFFSLERSQNEVWSNEDQQRRFPGDTGLSYLASLQNQDIQWVAE